MVDKWQTKLVQPNYITALINDNPLHEYVVKADAALAQTLLGVNPMQGFNTNNYTATDNKDGQSITTLDVGSAATTSMFTVVRYANDPENKDEASAFAATGARPEKRPRRQTKLAFPSASSDQKREVDADVVVVGNT